MTQSKMGLYSCEQKRDQRNRFWLVEVWLHDSVIAQGQDPWNVISICRNASSMWTYSFQMHWNAAGICENAEKFGQIWFCIFLYVDTELRIPEAFPCPFGQDAENASTGILSKNHICDRDLLFHFQHSY